MSSTSRLFLLHLSPHAVPPSHLLMSSASLSCHWDVQGSLDVLCASLDMSIPAQPHLWHLLSCGPHAGPHAVLHRYLHSVFCLFTPMVHLSIILIPVFSSKYSSFILTDHVSAPDASVGRGSVLYTHILTYHRYGFFLGIYSRLPSPSIPGILLWL